HVVAESGTLAVIGELLDQLPTLEHIICLGPTPARSAGDFPSAIPLWTEADLDRLPNVNLGLRIDPDDISYVIFTSGSTGKAKGVIVCHGAVVNLINWANRISRIDFSYRILFVSSLSFDLSVYDILGMLAAGASIQIVSGPDLRDPEILLN